jgi:hypothetical protein
VPPPNPGLAPGHNTLRFLAPTTVYARQSNGYIGAHTTYGSPGEVEPVNAITVPIDPVHHTGGSFWELKGGAKAGWLVSAHDGNVSVS